jgi:t-SNARE complex subunit (syntaxin)
MDHDDHHDAPTLAEIEQLQAAIAKLNETLRESIALFSQLPTPHDVEETDGSVDHLNHTLEHTQELFDHLPSASQIAQIPEAHGEPPDELDDVLA